jgi:hypothetical protein
MEPLPASSTAGLMEAVLTYNSAHEEDLGADDRDVTPTPENLTAGMDVDNNPSPVLLSRCRVLHIMANPCEQDCDPPSPPPSQVRGIVTQSMGLGLMKCYSLSLHHVVISCLFKTVF